MAANVSRDGHAPDHVKIAFCDWLAQGQGGRFVKVGGQQETIEWLLGQLWYCMDVLPDKACAALEMPQGSTYAAAIQELRSDISDEN